MTETEVQDLVSALGIGYANDPFMCWQEGHFTVAIARELHLAGHVLQLPTTNTGVAKYLWGATTWLGRRRHYVPEGSGDVTVIEPELAYFEVKTRPDVGSKAQAGFGGIAQDLDRVANDPDALFMFAFESELYKSFEGMAKKRRPPSAAGQLVQAFFERRARLPYGTVCQVAQKWRGQAMEMWYLKIQTGVGEDRMLVAGRAYLPFTAYPPPPAASPAAAPPGPAHPTRPPSG